MHKIKALALATLTSLLYFAPAAPVAAACDSLPTDKGQATAKVAVVSDGQYALWMRLWQAKNDSDSLLLQVDARCPVIIGDAGGEGFSWINYQNGDPKQDVQLGLNTGDHTFVMAGREAGVGIDKVMLIADGCIPEGTGDNCQQAAQPTNIDPTVQAEAMPVAAETDANNLTIFIFAACAVSILGSLGFMVWKYLAFVKRTVVTLGPDQHGLVVGGAMNPASSQWLRLRHFTSHHKLAVAVCLTIVVAATVVGFAVAAQGVPQFESESSALSGTAKIVDNADASGGKYVLFEAKKAESSGGSGSNATNNSGGSSGGSSSGSGGGSSGGSSTGSCALPKYPDASCTGVPAGTSLTVIADGLEINTNNTIIEGKEIHGCVDVNASGVIIRKSKIIGDCFYMVYRHSSSGTNLLIEDSEISCTDHNGTAIGDTGITVKRSNIHGCENGFDVDGVMTIEDNYIHDLTQTGDDPHTDGIQITTAGGGNITIKHNRIYAFTNGVNGTSAIIEPDVPITNVLIQDNLFAGGAYTIYCKRNGHYDSSWSMVNNHFSTINGPNVGAYGPMTDCQDEINVSGNVYHESGLPVPVQ
jgi:hypothetical protein